MVNICFCFSSDEFTFRLPVIERSFVDVTLPRTAHSRGYIISRFLYTETNFLISFLIIPSYASDAAISSTVERAFRYKAYAYNFIYIIKTHFFSLLQ